MTIQTELRRVIKARDEQDRRTFEQQIAARREARDRAYLTRLQAGQPPAKAAPAALSGIDAVYRLMVQQAFQRLVSAHPAAPAAPADPRAAAEQEYNTLIAERVAAGAARSEAILSVLRERPDLYERLR